MVEHETGLMESGRIVGFRLREEEHEALRLLAFQNRRSMSAELRAALVEHLRRNRSARRTA